MTFLSRDEIRRLRAAAPVAALSLCPLLQAGPAAGKLDVVQEGRFVTQTARAGPTLEILSWNIERGMQLDAVVELIAGVRPDVCILQEVDQGAHRTGRVDVAAVIARRLGLNYVFAPEFVELGQGTEAAPAYHGQAVLTRLPIRSARILRYQRQSSHWLPRWYLPNWAVFQRRLGGRMALAVTLDVHGGAVTIYNTHLESRISDSGRRRQLEELIHAAANDRSANVIVAGDFNVPEPDDALVEDFAAAGFRSVVAERRPTVYRKPAIAPAVLVPMLEKLGFGRMERTVDWVFTRGLKWIRGGRVLDDSRASDHFAIVFEALIDGAGGVAAPRKESEPPPVL